jgi:hypothetical protein
MFNVIFFFFFSFKKLLREHYNKEDKRGGTVQQDNLLPEKIRESYRYQQSNFFFCAHRFRMIGTFWTKKNE